MELNPRDINDRQRILSYLERQENPDESNWTNFFDAMSRNQKMLLKGEHLFIKDDIDPLILKLLDKLNVTKPTFHSLMGLAAYPQYDMQLAVSFYQMFLTSKNSRLQSSEFWKYEEYINRKLFILRYKNRMLYDKFVHTMDQFFVKEMEDSIKKIRFKINEHNLSLSHLYRKFYYGINDGLSINKKFREKKIYFGLELYKKYYEQDYLYLYLFNFIRINKNLEPLNYLNFKAEIKKTFGEDTKGFRIKYLLNYSHSKKFKLIIESILRNALRNIEAHEDFLISGNYIKSKSTPYKVTLKKFLKMTRKIEELFWALVYIHNYHVNLKSATYDYIEDHFKLVNLPKRLDNIHNRGLRAASWYEHEGRLHIHLVQFIYSVYHINRFRKDDLTKVIILPDVDALRLYLQTALYPGGIGIDHDLDNNKDLFYKYNNRKIFVHIQNFIPIVKLPKQSHVPKIEVGGFEYYAVNNERIHVAKLQSNLLKNKE